MFRDMAIYFLLLHCKGAVTFNQTVQEPNRHRMIHEIICFINKNDTKWTNQMFDTPINTKVYGCLTCNMNTFRKEVNHLHLKNHTENISNSIHMIRSNLKCIQSCCPKLNVSK
ncbi:hypothetical protein XENTR_v10008198 [Xenopus tropicalis]|nr:hypothetical protein XENTR_v10008198 [Xenopus tropicalis]